MILYKLIAFCFNLILRRFYWIYTLSRIKGLKDISIQFPIHAEGKGTTIIGQNSEIRRNAGFQIAKQAKLKMGESCLIESNAIIQIGGIGELEVCNRFKLGNFSRLMLHSNWFINDDVVIANNCNIFSRESGYYGTLKIGKGTHVGDNTIIDVSDSVLIGDEVAFGPNCVIYTHDHVYKDESKAAWKGGVVCRPVTIENGAWIGSGVIILPGVTIGYKSVVAAGSVVTKNIKSQSVWGGVPACFIKEIE